MIMEQQTKTTFKQTEKMGLEQINQLSIVGLTFILTLSSVFDFLYNYFEKSIILLVSYIMLMGLGIILIILMFNKKEGKENENDK